MRCLTPWLLCAALLATGCSLKSPAPEWSGYLLATARPQAASPGSAGTLHVGTVRVAPAFAGSQLMVRASQFGYEPDFYHRFLSSPDEMLRTELVGWLTAAGWSGAALPAPDEATAPETLAVYVPEFYADVRDAKRPEAVLALDARVTDAAGATVFRRGYAERVPAAAKSADALVAALNTALVQALGKLEADLKAAGVGGAK